MMFLTVKEDVHVGGGHGLPCGPRMQCTTKPLMYQHLLLLTLFIMVLCTPGSLGSTNRVAVQEQGINRCNRVNTCWECIKKPSCAWCTDGTEDGTEWGEHRSVHTTVALALHSMRTQPQSWRCHSCHQSYGKSGGRSSQVVRWIEVYFRFISVKSETHRSHC